MEILRDFFKRDSGCRNIFLELASFQKPKKKGGGGMQKKEEKEKDRQRLSTLYKKKKPTQKDLASDSAGRDSRE